MKKLLIAFCLLLILIAVPCFSQSLFEMQQTVISARKAAAGGGGGGTQVRYPNSDGTFNYSMSEGTDGWALIDETPADGDTTYVYRPDSAGFFRVGFPVFTVPPGATNISVTIYVTHHVDAGDDISFNFLLRVNGSDNPDLNGDDSTTWTEIASAPWTENPDTTSAWTVDDINGVGANPLQQIGIQCLSVGAGETHYITQLRIEVSYD